ncbi:hypothetical protein ACFSHQ_27120 [Gemmobacter lanyuensis]
MLRLIASLLFLSCAGAAHAIATDPAPAAPTRPILPIPAWSGRSITRACRAGALYRRLCPLDWKPEKPEQSALTVTIDPLSVRTDFPGPRWAISMPKSGW